VTKHKTYLSVPVPLLCLHVLVERRSRSGDVIKLAGFDWYLKPVPWPLSVWSLLL
jgi:hypothetical protein